MARELNIHPRTLRAVLTGDPKRVSRATLADLAAGLGFASRTAFEKQIREWSR